MIDRIKKKVEFFINTENRGNFTPSKFELALHDAIQSRNEEYFYDINRIVTRENRGFITGGIINIPDKYSEKILHYLEESNELTVANNRVQLPENWRYIDEVELKRLSIEDGSLVAINFNSEVLEFCRNKREFNVLKGQATYQYPTYALIQNDLLLAPSKNGDTVTLTYLRKPKYPKWTYTTINDVELFNPDAEDFQDADIHSSEEDEIVRRVLMSFGVNLKETDIQAYAVNQDNINFNQDNAS